MPSAASRRSALRRSASSTESASGDGVDAFGEIPQPLTPDAAGDRDLAARLHQLEHHRDVAVVRPAGRGPGDGARVRDVARRNRPGPFEELEDLAPGAVVVAKPVPCSLVARAVRRSGEIEAEIAHGTNERVELEQRPVDLERLLQLLRPVRRAEAAPGDEVCVRRDCRGRVDLQQRQPLDHREQLLGPRRVEQLGANGDAPRLRLRQPVHRQEGNGGQARGPPAVRTRTATAGLQATSPVRLAPCTRPRSARAPPRCPR